MAAMIQKARIKIYVTAVLSLILTCQALGSISSRINSIIAGKDLKRVEFAIEVLDASTGKAVYLLNPNKPMIPASNMKIVTSAAALEILGNGYEFKTQIAMLGNTLVVIGGGDPLLCDKVYDAQNDRDSHWIFQDIIKALKSKNIKSIDGIIIDSTFFDDKRIHPSWPKQELNRPYACEISGLNFNSNCISINVKRVGSTASVSISPQTKYVKIVNQVTLKSTGNSAVGAYRNSEPNKLILKGKCRKETGFDVAIERPAMFFGFVLSEQLLAAGIKVDGPVSEKYVKNQPQIKTLKVYKTPLKDVLARCNKDSLNMAAESLVKTISAENTSGRINGERSHGFNLISRYLKNIGVNSEEYTLNDGCGLSRENRLSVNSISTVLLRVYHSKNYQLYKDTLAVGGVDGTIAGYYTESKYKGNVFGKTGYISGVRAFSGYTATDDGDYIFSILSSGGGSHVRAAINDIVKAIIDD